MLSEKASGYSYNRLTQILVILAVTQKIYLINILTTQNCKSYSVEQVEEESISNQDTEPNPIPLSFSKDTATLKNPNSHGCSILNLYQEKNTLVFLFHVNSPDDQ
jgi:hypothetical protein